MSDDPVLVLRASSFDFNQWRATNPSVTPMMVGVELNGIKALQVNLSGAKLIRAGLKNVDLSGATFQGADLTDADLSGALLTGVSFKGACLRRANLSNCQGRGIQFQGACMEEAVLSGAFMSALDFDGADVTGMKLPGAALKGIDLNELALRGAVIDGAVKMPTVRRRPQAVSGRALLLMFSMLVCSLVYAWWRMQPLYYAELTPDNVVLEDLKFQDVGGRLHLRGSVHNKGDHFLEYAIFNVLVPSDREVLTEIVSVQQVSPGAHAAFDHYAFAVRSAPVTYSVKPGPARWK